MTPDSEPSVSPRIALARVADQVVTRMPGVALTDGGGRWVTAERERHIRGITSVAQPDARFELDLHLVVAWPPEPLAQLADDLRRRVRAAAKRAQLDGHLGDVHVHIVSVQDPDGRDPVQRS